MSTNNLWADSPWRNPAIVFEELPESLILEDLIMELPERGTLPLDAKSDLDLE